MNYVIHNHSSIQLRQSFFGQKIFLSYCNKQREKQKREAAKLYFNHFPLYLIQKEVKVKPYKIDFLISQRQIFTKAINNKFVINIMTKESSPNFAF